MPQLSNLSRQASIFSQQRPIPLTAHQQQRSPFYNYVPYQHTPMPPLPQDIQQYFAPYVAQNYRQSPLSQNNRPNSYRQQFQPHQNQRFNGNNQIDLKWKQPPYEGTSTEEDSTSNEEGISPLRDNEAAKLLDQLQYRSFRLTVNAATDASTEYNFNSASFNEEHDAPELFGLEQNQEPEPEPETPAKEIAFIINFEQPKWQ